MIAVPARDAGTTPARPQSRKDPREGRTSLEATSGPRSPLATSMYCPRGTSDFVRELLITVPSASQTRLDRTL